MTTTTLFMISVSLICTYFAQSTLRTISGHNTLPQPCSLIVVGYNELSHTAVLLSGTQFNGSEQIYLRQMMQFRNHTFMMYQPDYLPLALKIGFAVHYTQLNDILWILNNEDNLYTFNVETAQLRSNITTIPTTVAGFACIASMTQFVFVLGSTTASRIVQIYNITSNQWLPDIPSMKAARAYLGCIIVQNYLYAIGGLTNTIEKLYVDDELRTLDIQTWNYTQNTFAINEYMLHISTTYYGTDIYVIGGWTTSQTTASPYIYIIDTITESVSIWADLDKAVAATSSIFIDNTLFIFGGNYGETGKLATDTYQYITINATPSSTTLFPSVSPSLMHSIAPSSSPSHHPSLSASTAPFVTDPTNAPNKRTTTIEPSGLPSLRFSEATYASHDGSAEIIEHRTTDEYDFDDVKPKKNFAWITLILAIVLSVSFIIVLFVFCRFGTHKYVQQRKEPVQMIAAIHDHEVKAEIQDHDTADIVNAQHIALSTNKGAKMDGRNAANIMHAKRKKKNDKKGEQLAMDDMEGMQITAEGIAGNENDFISELQHVHKSEVINKRNAGLNSSTNAGATEGITNDENIGADEFIVRGGDECNETIQTPN